MAVEKFDFDFVANKSNQRQMIKKNKTKRSVQISDFLLKCFIVRCVSRTRSFIIRSYLAYEQVVRGLVFTPTPPGKLIRYMLQNFSQLNFNNH